MNQILEFKKNKNKIMQILKFQILMSIIGFFCVCIFFYLDNLNNSNNENFSQLLSLHSEINSIYKAENINNSNIFCTIRIPKLQLEYIVFNEFSEELLKLSPCKFYGPEINKNRQYCYRRS